MKGEDVMNKDNGLNNSNFKSKEDAKKVSASDRAVAPDFSLPNTSAPNSAPNPPGQMGYGKDRPSSNELDESQMASQKAKGEAPGNEVETSLNPDEENIKEDKTDK